MRIRVGDAEYSRVHHNQLKLRHIVELQAELTALGGIGGVTTWGQVQAAATELLSLPLSEQSRHPHWPLFYVLTVWSSMLAAGEAVKFADVLDLNQDDIEFVPDAADVAAMEAVMKATEDKATRRGKGQAAPQ